MAKTRSTGVVMGGGSTGIELPVIPCFAVLLVGVFDRRHAERDVANTTYRYRFQHSERLSGRQHWGANSHRRRATPGHHQSLSAQFKGLLGCLFLSAYRHSHDDLRYSEGRTLLTGNANPLTGFEPETARQERGNTDQLISITDIRALFKLGRTAAYELTRRPEFPAPVQVSRRCLRWWASEVNAYADSMTSPPPRVAGRPAPRERT